MSFQAGAEQRSAAVAQRSPPISPPETAGSSGAPICCDGTTDAAADSAAAAARALDSSAASSQQPKAKHHRRRRNSRPAAASSAPSQPSEQDVYQVGLVVNDLILFIVAADLIEWESFDVVCIRFPAMPGSRDAMYLDMARAGLIAQHPYEHLSQSFSARSSVAGRKCACNCCRFGGKRGPFTFVDTGCYKKTCCRWAPGAFYAHAMRCEGQPLAIEEEWVGGAMRPLGHPHFPAPAQAAPR